MSDETVATFIDLTGSTADRARQYLKLCDNSVEQAIELYFASGGIDFEGPSSAAPTQTTVSNPPELPLHTHPSARQQSYPRTRQLIDLDSDKEDDDDIEITGSRSRSAGGGSVAAALTPTSRTPPVTQAYNPEEDDAAMARRLQEELYAGGDIGGGLDADGYRAPIARTRETLVGPGSSLYDLNDAADMEDAVLEQFRARERTRRQARPGNAGIFNQQSIPASIWNDTASNSTHSAAHRSALSQATAGASEVSAKSSLLAEMYRPPFEIMSRLKWEEARSEGKENEKWILINVQDAAIFDCQLLNRDLWKHPGVKETIKENFLFMQYSKDDPRGREYIQYYFQARDSEAAYPHIAIVDPRTGEQVKVWSGVPAPTAPDFLIQLHEFLDRYSLNVTAKNPVAKRKAESKREKPVDRMTEDEMLELALQNSLAGAAGGPKDDDPDDLTRSSADISNGKGKGKGKAKPTQDAHSNEAEMTDADDASTNGHISDPPSPFATISSTNPHTEPPADATLSSRIQFRHPTGRVVRRFTLADPVRRIYEWLKAEPMPGKQDVDFELIFMGRNLLAGLDGSIEEAGLRNGTVMVEFGA